MRRARCLVFMATVLLLAAACSDDKIEAPGGFVADVAGEDFTWTDDVAAIFEGHCIFCHSTENSGDARNGAPADTNFNTYEEARESAAKALQFMSIGFMPPAGNDVGAEPVPPSDQAIIRAWIDAGMPR